MGHDRRMPTESARRLLESAIREVAASPSSIRKLGRAAYSRSNLEREWVYEIDGTDTLEDVETKREVSLGGRHHADLSIEDTPIEFKSTKPWYAVEGAFEPRIPPKRMSAEFWLSGDLSRMQERDGIFVLLVSTDGYVPQKGFAELTVEGVRTEGLQRYTSWLQARANALRPGAVVDAVGAGQGTYAGRTARHDALIVWWPNGAGT